MWIFNVAGSLGSARGDCISNRLWSIGIHGSTYWIPAFLGSCTIVTHYITFIILWKYWTPGDLNGIVLTIRLPVCIVPGFKIARRCWKTDNCARHIKTQASILGSQSTAITNLLVFDALS